MVPPGSSTEDSVSDRLLRVTAVAGGRRSDLAVPGAVAVAELVPDLARAVGLLDPAAAYAGYGLHAHGRRLQPDRGLVEQGVGDGTLLAVTARADEPVPLTHDDLAEATAEVVGRRPAWQPADARRTTLLAGLLATAVGLVALAHDRLPDVPASWSAPGAVLLALVVLAGGAVPAAAVALGVARVDQPPVDPVRLQAMAARSQRVLLAGSAAGGALVTLLAPVVADDPVGALLAVDCCVVGLLRARRLRARTPALVAVHGGLAGLLATAVALLVRDPASRPVVALTLLGAGATASALARLPAAPPLLRARLWDLLETLALVALAPLVLLAADGLALATGG